MWDILSRMSRLLPRRFFALVPIPELGLTEIGTGARPSCDTRPGLRSRPLGRRSGCSSAEPYPPPRPFFSLRPSCLSPNLLHRATGQQPDCLTPPATCDRAQRGSAHRDRRVPPPAWRIRAHRAPGKAHQHRSVPAYLYRGTGTNLPPDQSIEPLPARGRSAQPASAL